MPSSTAWSFRIFPKILGLVVVTSVHYRVAGDLEMKMVSGGFFCRSKSLPPAAESLLAQLWPGEGAPSLLPPSLCCGGPGAPPATAAEVAQAFRQSLRRTTRKHLEGATRNSPQYEMGKVYGKKWGKSCMVICLVVRAGASFFPHMVNTP